ncbi:MAG TPA: serine/threonine-protein kinase [Polyangia bacterium]|nr:serine/threonine-protein kinase [Polyangia bacterium]
MTGQRHTVSSLRDSSVQMHETFGRYRLLGLLGQGGMGRLYIAERRGVRGFVKIVALKLILPHLADSAELRDMFLNEARIAARLEHPNIVATYELGEVEGKYFISMEYLPGEDLSAVIGRCQGGQPIPIEIAAGLTQQVAKGLHYAHDVRDGQGRLVGLVHRDVNPRNIFITYHGGVKLLDFGMVRNSAGPKSVPGVFKGKFGYCAPEQLEGGRIDRRTDVFCLGIVLWECLTGARLFDAATDVETIDAVRSRRVERPSVLRPEVPRLLEEIVLRALAREPVQRYQSAQEMSEELDRFLLGRNNRPTTTTVGQWIEALFGSERAALKKSISQGDSAEGALHRLKVIDAARPGPPDRERSSSGRSTAQPRALWSTSFGAGPSSGSGTESAQGAASEGDDLISTRPVSISEPSGAGSGASARGGATRIVVVGSLIAVAGLGGIGALAMRAQSSHAGTATSTAAQATTSLDLRSQPAGASIFVDGRPTGLQTPAVLDGLPVGRTVKLRLDLGGYAPASKETTLGAGQSQTLSFTLESATGTVRLVGVPRQATAELDDRPVDPSKPIAAAVGAHRLRLELEQSVLLSKTIEVRANAETKLDLTADRSAE